jgi:hypothetical protein
VNNPSPDVFKFNITMYTVSFVLVVMKAKSVYLIQFINGGNATDPINVGSNVSDTKTVVNQIRTYAKTLTKGWSDWHFWLSDAFADAFAGVNIELDQYTGCRVDDQYFQVLLSKGGLHCYFVMEYVQGVVLKYSLNSYPDMRPYSECNETLDSSEFNITSIAGHVLRALKFLSAAGEGPSRLISPQGNKSGPRNSQPNQPAQDSDSSQLATMSLYAAIVELLVAVHANQQHLNDKEVLRLLQEAKRAIGR